MLGDSFVGEPAELGVLFDADESRLSTAGFPKPTPCLTSGCVDSWLARFPQPSRRVAPTCGVEGDRL